MHSTGKKNSFAPWILHQTSFSVAFMISKSEWIKFMYQKWKKNSSSYRRDAFLGYIKKKSIRYHVMSVLILLSNAKETVQVSHRKRIILLWDLPGKKFFSVTKQYVLSTVYTVYSIDRDWREDPVYTPSGRRPPVLSTESSFLFCRITPNFISFFFPPPLSSFSHMR